SLRDAVAAAHGRLQEGKVTPQAWGVERLRLIAAFQALCHGVSYAHDRGVVPRDIKPANVMMGEHGETILLDWGLAKVARPDGPGTLAASRSDRDLERALGALRRRAGMETVEGTVTGTPAYMSPEQAAGRI